MKKEFNEYKQQEEKQKLIDEITGIEKQRKKISKAKSTPKTKQKPKKIRTFDDYYSKTYQLTSKKLLKEQRENIKLESNKKNQLLIILLKNI